jgi:endonuclease YncB( thermonuclease family)
MKTFALIATALSLIIPTPTSAQTLSGIADIIDGDTLSIRGQSARIRFYGVDAP